jgi:hypothetical protein
MARLLPESYGRSLAVNSKAKPVIDVFLRSNRSIGHRYGRMTRVPVRMALTKFLLSMHPFGCKLPPASRLNTADEWIVFPRDEPVTPIE